MKVFISWSGDLSHSLASVLKDWLPNVIQQLDPYVSNKDIDKGARWSIDIATQLQQAKYGIICLTPSNLASPWIHFEAGSVAKVVDDSRVVPLLLNVKVSQVTGPLAQFQCAKVDEDDIQSLVEGVNRALPEDSRLSEERLRHQFAKWWPDLRSSLEALSRSDDDTDESVDITANDAVQEEILEAVRVQGRQLSEFISTCDRNGWFGASVRGRSRVIGSADAILGAAALLEAGLDGLDVPRSERDRLVDRVRVILRAASELRRLADEESGSRAPLRAQGGWHKK